MATMMQQTGETVGEAAKRWAYRVLRVNLLAKGLPPDDRELGYEHWVRMAQANCPLEFAALMEAVEFVIWERTGRWVA